MFKKSPLFLFQILLLSRILFSSLFPLFVLNLTFLFDFFMLITILIVPKNGFKHHFIFLKLFNLFPFMLLPLLLLFKFIIFIDILHLIIFLILDGCQFQAILII